MNSKLTKPIKMALFASIALAAFSSPALAQRTTFGPKNAKEVYYWISNKATLPLFVRYDYVGMKKIANQLHVQVRVAGPTNFSIPQFISDVNQICAQKPAGVVVVGGWSPALTEPVDQCIKMGVPTAVDDGDLPASKRLTYVGTDWTQIGVAQAKAMIDALPKGGNIALLSILNATNMRQAVAGFKAYLSAHGHGRYHIVADENDHDSSPRAASETSSLLAAHPHLAGIAGFDSESGPGIVAGLKEADEKPGRIAVTAMERTPAFFKTIEQGWTTAIVSQNRELFVYYAVRMLYDYKHNGLKTLGLSQAKGGDPIPNDVYVRPFVVTKANVKAVLAGLHVK